MLTEEQQKNRKIAAATMRNKYKQTTGVMTDRCGGFCGLGALLETYRTVTKVGRWNGADLFYMDGLEESEILNDFYGFKGALPEIDSVDIVDLNDDHYITFDQFADALEDGSMK